MFAPGHEFVVTRAASPQFAQPIRVRMIRERTDRHTYHGWAWIEVYEIDGYGKAVDRRELYVMPAGLIPTNPSPPLPTRSGGGPGSHRE
ncbi:hypothetical protein AB0M35_17105 [Micromonospora sp. NPDC051196]|uniref:hypothetical protein n=1 Tax=Micromonospora sp. NPDC051196 TaxID=3155281 RepID=UPI003420035B